MELSIDPAFKRAEWRKPDERALIMSFHTDRKGRLGPILVEAGQTAEIIAGPAEVGFHAYWLVVPLPNAESFSILDIKIGWQGREESRLLRPLAKPVPAASFADVSVPLALDFGDCNPCEQIVLVVKNESREDRVFMAAVVGYAVGEYWESIKNNPLPKVEETELEQLLNGTD